MDQINPCLDNLVNGWHHETLDAAHSFLRTFEFCDRSKSVHFITEIIQVHKLNICIDALASDLSEVKVSVKTSSCDPHLTTCVLAMTEIEDIYNLINHS